MLYVASFKGSKLLPRSYLIKNQTKILLNSNTTIMLADKGQKDQVKSKINFFSENTTSQAVESDRTEIVKGGDENE